ncbi:hypothetical protein [Methylobacterium gnaphalii]|uniref:hypothetical protein n=1 Tax=Methylobacterium gnaphalii TaxID=1010610 RepID=UPI001EE20C88|nr:hypothetical protein [Methylobacterium gnaphalii]GJD71421.1 hypothetical protein MMMDOFMJ_4380 [Methylobacterium gnaphalii]GLS50930.1 hypothetical protein GCM10007885_37840 [Methylobacterium gnaphalii]
MPTLRDMLTPEVAEGLERYLASLEDAETTPQAINRIVADWLTSHGYLDFTEIPEGERDQDRWA